MKQLIIILQVFILFISCKSKNGNNSQEYAVNDTDSAQVFSCYEKMPSFPDGDKALLEFIKNETVYPQSAIRDSIEGRVFITFTIDTNGVVRNPEVAKGLSYDIDNECLRVVERLPNWTPGELMGKKIDIRYTLPFHFSLRNSDQKKLVITPKCIQKKKSLEIKLYPNPSDKYCNLEIDFFVEELQYQIISQNGTIAQQDRILNKKQRLNLQDIQKGIYIVRVFSSDSEIDQNKKLVINKNGW